MIRIRTLAGAIFFLYVAIAGLRAEPQARIRAVPPSGWVDQSEQPDYRAPDSADANKGFDILLSDDQYSVAERAHYSRLAYRITSSDGVQYGSTVSVMYDPAYESVDFHHIRIIRDGQVIDRLDLSQFQSLQQEKDLERSQYNGQLTALLLLNDVRVGDVVDFAFTRNGENPVFAGHFNSFSTVTHEIPIHRLRIRLLTPAGHAVQARMIGPAAVTATHRTLGTTLESTWSANQVPAVVPDPDLPAGFDPFSYLEFTDFPDWHGVASWAQTLYRVPQRPPAAVAARAAQVSASALSDEDRTVAVLKFVQDQIRYLGIEVGIHSHRPNPPELVLERRYGDCKDKVMLLCTMLQSLGIEAIPALTHSSRRQALLDHGPSPLAFDHVIARVTIYGKSYWIDPTLTYQEGDLAHHSLPPYQWALPVEASTTALAAVQSPSEALAARGATPVPPNSVLLDQAGESPEVAPLDGFTEISPPSTSNDFPESLPDSGTKLSTREFYTCDTLGQPFALTVEGVYSGAYADAMRGHLKTTSLEQVGKEATNYRSKLYPKIRAVAPPTWSDDPVHNQIKITSHYIIDDIWQRVEGKKTQRVDFYPMSLRDFLLAPDSPNRTMPMNLAYPLNISCEITIISPWTGHGAPSHFAVHSPYFEGSVESESSGRTSQFRFSLVSHADRIPAAAVGEYTRQLAELRQAAGFSLTVDPEAIERAKHFRLNWLLVITIVVTAAGAISGAVWLATRKAQVPPALSPESRLAGLGGWLVLVGIGTVVRPLNLLLQFIKGFVPFCDARIWRALTDPGSPSYRAGYEPLVLSEAVADLILIVAEFLLVWLYFRKRRSYPKLFVVVHCASWAVVLGDHLLTLEVMGAVSNAITSAFYQGFVQSSAIVAIWVPYMLVSRRVRATFVR